MAEPILGTQKLHGKVAVITGGASGIGEATARLFASHGARMVVIADIQDELGRQVAASIGASTCNYRHCDVTDEDQVRSLVDWTIRNHGHLDVMFSNAGVASPGDQTILDLDLDAFDRVLAVNARGTAACLKHAARAMVEGRVRGSIVCTASVTGSYGGERNSDYFASKHAVVGLVRCGSRQLGTHGIRVNCVSPSGVATPGLCKKMGVGTEEAEAAWEGRTSLKGIRLNVKMVAEAVLFLACDDSQFVSGHDLVVDGGFLAGTSS